MSTHTTEIFGVAAWQGFLNGKIVECSCGDSSGLLYGRRAAAAVARQHEEDGLPMPHPMIATIEEA